MTEARGFIERVAALVGRTTYREPVNGHGTAPGLTDQDVAAALAMGRRRVRVDGHLVIDHHDVGPEIAIGMVCQVRHRKPDVCAEVERAIAMTLRRIGRRQRLAIAVNAAYEDLVMMVRMPKPPRIPSRLWELYYSIAFGSMQAAAENALLRAELALYRAGRPLNTA